MTDQEQDLIAAASALTASINRQPVVSLVPLAGGKNNRVFRAALADGSLLVLKSYFYDARDTRDRLGAEWGFSRYAMERGVDNLPQPLASDPARRLGLYSFIAGHKLAPGEVTRLHVNAALDFVLAVNRPPRSLSDMPVGSEACFTLREHIETAERRVRRLSTIDAEAPLRAAVVELVTRQLTPTWYIVRDRLEATAQRDAATFAVPVGPDEQIISPSDFGFHNALVDETGRVAFLDFEYAGRDDPAKFVCDFFCQPEVPVPLTQFTGMVDRMVEGLALPERHKARCVALLDLYRIKWACIILNQFLPVGAARRAFAESSAWLDRCATQLAKASAIIAEASAGT